ncbi:ABC transporter permease [Terasakiella pusilla]|uniref:ABC transporter permease n=1 Tax=Terasakiella pusilla TaxID=64973 RepID=UPI00048D948D|nr:ABC transporter permease [Terasakiella pusilla]
MRTYTQQIAKAPLSAQFGLFVICVYVFCALFAPFITPFSETEIIADAYAPADASMWLGADNLGRDMFTRLIYGARNTVGVAFATTVLAFLIGGTIGMLSATVGGWFDQVMSRTVDILMAVPQLIFALLILSVVGTNTVSLIFVIAVLDATRVFRISRATAMNVVTLDFVEAARLRGESKLWIISREILPNISAPLIAEFGLRFCFVFLFISGLSFLGLGIQPPLAEWGGMVRENAVLITFGEYTPLLPAAAVALLTVAVNFVVDWLLHLSSGLKD